MKPIRLFEHQILRKGEQGFTAEHLEVLERYYGEKGVPYYKLVHNGVKFCEYVGVLQVGDLTIEILPKIDKQTTDKNTWQQVLIHMLRTVQLLPISTSDAALKLHSGSVLDVYIERFLTETTTLLHRGLTKAYHTTESNQKALKGRLLFHKHIQQNLVHAERFYVKHTTYDPQHILNQILYKTLCLLQTFTLRAALQSTLNRLLLDFPELPDLAVTESMFERLTFTRKIESYRTAIFIARLLLFRYHPDVVQGRTPVLALLFDMNRLWESYIYHVLKKSCPPACSIREQARKQFWKPDSGTARSIRPDIVITLPKTNENIHTLVLDTKWKLPVNFTPTDDDLKQLFVYSQYFEAKDVFLLYPGVDERSEKGTFLLGNTTCHIKPISILKEQILDKKVGEKLWESLLNDNKQTQENPKN